MINITETITKLSLAMSISGHERRIFDTIKDIAADSYDEIHEDNVGNITLIRRCGKENAPCIMLDAHLDEIGMIVTQIKDGGFLKVLNIGGIDTRILPASIVTVYGKEEPFPAVVVSTPPHLQKPGESSKLPKISDIMLDTGMSKEYLEKYAPIGTPVGFEPTVTVLKNNLLAGKGFDDKACAAVLLHAAASIDKPEDFDVCVTLTTREEVSGVGAKCAAYNLNPTAVIVTDVNFGRTPDVDKQKSLEVGKGAGVSISAVTHKKLTRSIINYAKETEKQCQTIVEIKSTGTNADGMPYIREGLAAAVMSLPLKNMHTPTEIISTDDAKSMSDLIAGFISDRKRWDFTPDRDLTM